jgi:tetratricopeptide (TPR) repeat protein
MDAYPYLMDIIEVECELPVAVFRYSDDAQKREMLQLDDYLRRFLAVRAKGLQDFLLPLKQFVERTTIAFDSMASIKKQTLKDCISRSELPPDLIINCSNPSVSGNTIHLHPINQKPQPISLQQLVEELRAPAHTQEPRAFIVRVFFDEIYRDGNEQITTFQDREFEIWLRSPWLDISGFCSGDSFELWATNDWSEIRTWQKHLGSTTLQETIPSQEEIRAIVWDNPMLLHSAKRHRDLHCGNVLACESGFALIDFGDTGTSFFLSDAIQLEIAIWVALSAQMLDSDFDLLSSFARLLQNNHLDLQGMAQQSSVLFVAGAATRAIRTGMSELAADHGITNKEISYSYCLAILRSLRFAGMGNANPNELKVRLKLFRHWHNCLHDSIAPLNSLLPTAKLRTTSRKLFPPDKYLTLPASLVPNRAIRESLSDWATTGIEPVLLLEGITGAGKSLSSWIWAHYDVNPDRSPPSQIAPIVPIAYEFDGVFWWSFDPRDQDLKGESNLSGFDDMVEEALSHFRTLVDPFANTDNSHGKTDELLSVLESNRFLLIIDGLEAVLQRDPQSKDKHEQKLRCSEVRLSQLLRRLSDRGVQSKILITSQVISTEFFDDGGELIRGVKHLKCIGYEPGQAREYLRLRVEGSDSTLDSIAQHYSYHPATLALVAALLSDLDAATALSTFERFRITAPTKLQGRTSMVLSSLFDKALTAEELHAIEVLALFRSIGRSQELQGILKCNNLITRRIASRLSLLNLISVSKLNGDDCYRLHTIVHSYVNDRLNQMNRKQELHKAMADFFSSTAINSLPKSAKVDIEKLELIYSGSSNPDYLDNVSKQDLSLGVEYVHQLSQSGQGGKALEFYAERLHEILYFSQGDYRLCSELLTEAYRHTSDSNATSDLKLWACSTLGLCNALSGQPSDAIERYQEILAQTCDDGVRSTIERITFCNLGKELLTVGKLNDSLAAFEKGKACIVEGDSYNLAVIEDEIGLVLSYLGNWEKADRQFEIAELSIPDNPSDSWLMFKIKNMADKALSQVFRGNAEESLRIANLAKQLEERQIQNNHYHLWTIWVWAFAAIELHEIGSMERNASGDSVALSEIAEKVEFAINQCRIGGHHRLESHFLTLMGRLSLLSGRLEEAANWARQSQGISSHCGYRLRESDASLLLARIKLKLCAPEEAKFYLERAINLSRCPSGDPSSKFEYILTKCSKLQQTLSSVGWHLQDDTPGT